MPAVINHDLPRSFLVREYANNNPVLVVGGLFALLLAIQAIGFLLLGIGRWGLGFSEFVLVLDGLLALACVRIAFRRGQGVTALFWFLFGIDILILIVPTALQAYDTLFGQTVVSDSTRGLLYTLYGAPILMMLFLPETSGRTRVKSEIYLDLFQIAIVVGLIYSTFFFLPLRRMMPDDATLHSISISDAQSVLLLVAAFVRLQFARRRDLLLRLAIFVMVCAVATFTGDWFYLHNFTLASWFDLGWAIPLVAAGLAAITWRPQPEAQLVLRPAAFLSYLGTNLTLVALLSCISLLMNRWKQAYGGTLTNVAIAASLMAFSLRLALTQYGQQQEIGSRKAAQQKLLTANQTIRGLLAEVRVEASSATQMNELGALLQSSASREAVFQIIPARLECLFPGTSGTLSVLNTSRTRAELVAEWGSPHFDQPFALPESPSPVSAFGHDATGQGSTWPSSCPPANGSSISIPLIANEEAIGVLVVKEDNQRDSNSPLSHESETARRRQLAAIIAGRIALTISNLDLREALQAQAIRDPLTGLYNRRYMQEFLEREFHRARRRERSLSLMVIDIDHFKLYNDTFGHPAGDEALRLVGEVLIASVRAEDLACRYGGEEFVIIVTECPLRTAALRAEAVSASLKELYSERAGELPGTVTVSIGVASFPETTSSVDLLLKCADAALYQAKRGGRDRIVIAAPENDLTPSRSVNTPIAVARRS